MQDILEVVPVIDMDFTVSESYRYSQDVYMQCFC